MDTSDRKASPIRYRVTGSAAHSRLVPLLPSDWVDVSTSNTDAPDFLWENAPRHETRPFRDSVRAYSHLPNGTAILDSKWVLARLFDESTEGEQEIDSLETHCFRGVQGFQEFAQKARIHEPTTTSATGGSIPHQFPDLLTNSKPVPENKIDTDPPNWWVVKDASSNGAGGIWVVGPENCSQYASSDSSPLLADHAYVAQKYAWPLVLYGGRKCHVRVYGLFTSDGRAFVHRRAFLHVANQPFGLDNYQDSVHITNCCANSHDATQFAGEICADLLQAPGGGSALEDIKIVGLKEFWPSLRDTVARLAARAFPFVQGGQANNGFEYLGMDFILSYQDNIKPVACLLEVNAPPSQDTATGLVHAEGLHDSVIRDILSLWVFPKVMSVKEDVGGWQCVFQVASEKVSATPSKAAIINKMKWAICERKTMKLQEKKQKQGEGSFLQLDDLDAHQSFIRGHFPYCSRENSPIFFENAGGAQVPRNVSDAMRTSLEYRDRSVCGVRSTTKARQTLRTLLGAPRHDVFLGPNATTLLGNLALAFGRRGLLKRDDEIVISTENHMANVKAWIEVAKEEGAVVKWWTPLSEDGGDPTGLSSCLLEDLVTPRTRVVTFPHASNIIGELRDIASVQQTVSRLSTGLAHTVVDGVAASPHCFANVEASGVDWYVVSCHKLFGPHLGALCGKSTAVKKLHAISEKILEIGTLNYEASEGIVGLGNYFAALSTHKNGPTKTERSGKENAIATRPLGEQDPSKIQSCGTLTDTDGLSDGQVRCAYQLIQSLEAPLTRSLLGGLQRSRKVTIIEGRVEPNALRLPVVCFTHSDISSTEIVKKCRDAGVVCRHGTFLATKSLFDELSIDSTQGVVRFSLVHYNTMQEVHRALKVLEAIPGWQ